MSSFLASILKGQLQINDLPRWHDFLKRKEGATIRLQEVKSVRTEAQSRALHLWFSLIADELNNAGYTVQLVLKEKVELDWDGIKVKELLWRSAQQALLGKKSTTELKKTNDIDRVWEHLNRHLGEKFGIHVDFPHDEKSIE